MKSLRIVMVAVGIAICCNVKSQPYQYNGSEFISITFQTSQDVIDRLVPEPLNANSEGIINLDIGLQKMEIGLNYHEVILSIPAEFNDKNGGYCSLLYLDNSDAITGGREIWGFPKYYADISIEKDENNVSAKVTRNGNVVIEVNAELGKTVSIPELPDPLTFILKFIPSVEEGSVDVQQLNSVYMRNNTITKLQEAKAELTIKNIPDASVGEIPIIKILNASYRKSDFLLGYGKVEYDYLNEQ